MFTLASNLADLTFENFCVTKENRLAHAAALAVAEKPGTDYNPFFLHSVASTGTMDIHHLLAAIGNRIEKLQPEKGVLFVEGKELAYEIKHRNFASVKKIFFSRADILLLEKIQDLAEVSKDDLRGMVEYFSSEGRQIVLGSNLPPKDLPMIDFALATQFSVGMVVGIAGNEDSP